MTTVNMDEIVRILREELGVPTAYVEQTGGGCATIFAGPTWKDQYGDEHFYAAAGPGYWTHGWTNPDPANTALGELGDFHVGPDDGGMSDTPVWTAMEGETERSIAERIAAQSLTAPCVPHTAATRRDA